MAKENLTGFGADFGDSGARAQSRAVMRGAIPKLDKYIETGKGSTEALRVVGMMPPHAAELEPVYSKLTGRIAVPKIEGTDYRSALTALAITNILLYQTALPAREKDFITQGQQREMQARRLENIWSAYPSDEQSAEARRELDRSAQSLMSLVDGQFSTTATGVDARVQRSILRDLFSPTAIAELEKRAGDPEWNDRMNGLRSKAVDTVTESSELGEMLTGEFFTEAPRNLRRAVFMKALERAVGDSDDDASALQKFEPFFLTRDNWDVQMAFWGSVDKGEQTSLDVVDWFFANSENAGGILKPAANYGINLPDEKHVEGYWRRLAGIVADFQRRNPAHVNLVDLHGGLAFVGDLLVNGEISRPLLDVLQGGIGIIHVDKKDEARAETVRPKESAASLKRRIAGIPSDSIVYSSLPAEEQTQAVTLVVPPAAAAAEVAQPVGEAEKVPLMPRLEITAGKLLKDFRWPESQRLRREDVPGVLDHLQAQLDPDMNADALFYQVAESQEVVAEIGEPVPALFFPDLLPEKHLLDPLREIGVINVETDETGDSTIIIDAQRANITTSVGRSRILLEGSLHAGNNLVIKGAPKTFAGTPLHLLLNEAVLTTIKPRSTGTLKGKGYGHVNDRIDTYNNGIEPKNSPRIVKISKDDTDANVETESPVVIPLGNGLIEAELDWSQVAA